VPGISSTSWSRTRTFDFEKEDVEAAFLQGGSTQKVRNVLIEPTPELREKYGLRDDECLRLLKAVYGLVNAPLEWFLCINQWFLDHGWKAVQLEPCLYVLHNDVGKLCGAACIHVDDLLIAGWEDICRNKKDNPFPPSMSTIRGAFKWGSWEQDTFIQCGIRYTQLDTGEICLTFQEAAKKVPLIEAKFEKKQQVFGGSEKERVQTLCRTSFGSWQFLATQGMFWISAAVSILQGHVPEVDSIIVKEINKQVRKCHATAHHPLRFVPQQDTIFVAWSDGALKQRKGGGTQRGFLVCTPTPELLRGERRAVNVISHCSS